MRNKYLLKYRVFERYSWAWRSREALFNAYSEMVEFINEIKKGTECLKPEDIRIDCAFELRQIDIVC